MKNRKPRGSRVEASLTKQSTTDSYTNRPARLGQGTSNLASQGAYPLRRISHDYMLMLSLYRSAWIIRKAIDAIAEDMLKDMPKIVSEISPENLKKFNNVLTRTGTAAGLLSGLKWGRLFGGAVCLIAIKGHENLMEPLDLDTVEPDSYRGLIPFDRWSGVTPDAKLITDIDYPTEFGLPRSYLITTENGTMNVHHSRLLRFMGRDLPNWERQAELYWGLSEVELIYDELQKRDYTSWNIVSLITRAQILAVKDSQLAAGMSGLAMNNQAYNVFVGRMEAMSAAMNNQGLLVLPENGALESHQNSFGGLADIYNTFMLDIAGACETPVSRLYGRSITGLGQSGEGDLQVYYDTVEQKRNRELRPQMDKLYPIIAMSTWGEVPKDFECDFPPVRTMSNKDLAELAEKNTASVVAVYQADLIGKRDATAALKKASGDSGLFAHIPDEDIAAMPNTFASETGGGELDMPGLGEKGSGKDSAIPSVHSETMAALHGLDINIETQAGVHRTGPDWSHPMPADYGEIRGIRGADGDWLDCYVGSNPESDKVWIVDQLGFDGETFDEHKVMLGYQSTGTALADYMAGHNHSDQVFGAISGMSMGDFKKLTKSGGLIKPVAWRKAS